MRIGIDARELLGRPTGAGRYLDHLLRSWALLEEARRHQFVLFVPGDATLTAPVAAVQGLAVELVKAGTGTGWQWEQMHLRRALRTRPVDVFFAPAYTAPVGARVPLVVTIHDLSFVVHPEWFAPRERLRRQWLTRLTARAARLVITDSACMREEIVERLGVPAGRTRVVPLAPTVSLQAGPLDASSRDEPPCVLFVGSVFNRRHVPDLIGAFRLLAERVAAVRLEIVGENRSYPYQDLVSLARATGVADRISIREYVADTMLEALYARAGVFVFLSEYEGFGLTPLDAMACGVPVVVADTPVAREVYGDAAHYVRTGDLEATAAAMERLLFDARERAQALSRCRQVLARYGWERTGRATLAALEGAVS